MRLARLSHWKQATGVAIGATRVVAVTAAAMPGAPREVETTEAPIGEGGVAAALRGLHDRGALAGQVVVGLDPCSVFFMTRQHAPGTEIDVGQMLDAYFSSARPDGGLVADAIPVNVRGGAYVTLAACRRAVAAQVEEGLVNVPHTKRALEPAPFALFRLAQRDAAVPRGWKSVVRVIVDGERGLAILQRGRALLAWRPFSIAPGREVDGIAGVVRGLTAHGRVDLGVPSVDGVLLHAAPSLAGAASQAASACATEIRLVAPLSMSDKSVARGLAFGALHATANAPNLLKQFRPPLTVREIFPWSTAAVLATVAFGAWQSLASTTESYERRAQMAQTKLDSALRASRVKPSQLKAARKAALHEASLVSRFLAKRVAWAGLLNEMPAHMPDAAVFVGLAGHDQLVLPSIDKPDDKAFTDREIAIQGQVRVRADDAASDDVKELLADVAKFPALLAEFPRVDGAEVTRHQQKGQDVASFIVRCGAKRK